MKLLSRSSNPNRKAKRIEEIAPAKINLALHLRGSRDDGFHLLESLVVFSEFGDRLSVSSCRSLCLSVSGRFGAHAPAGPDNLVARAVRLVSNGQGVAVKLQKRIPVASGLGGGSSDAATVLRLLSVQRETNPTSEMLASLGTDVPVCFARKTSIVEGTGEIVSPSLPAPSLDLVIVNPGKPLETREVFQRAGAVCMPRLERRSGNESFDEFVEWLSRQRNDLEPVAMRMCPAITTVKQELSCSSGCVLARMSGSGASCFGLFVDSDSARAAAKQILLDHPDWWAVATRA